MVAAACGGATTGSPTGAPSAAPAGAATPVKKIVIATGAGAEAADMVAAAELGLFKKYGIEADIRPMANSNEGLDLVGSGQADIGTSTEAGGLLRRAKGLKIYIAAMGPRSGLNNALVVKDSVKTPKDLQGKKIGFPQGSSANYFFVRYVAKFGLTASTITTINAQPPELVAALNKGEIDGFFLWDPWPDRAVASIPGTKVMQRSGENDVYYAQNYVYFSQRMLDDEALGIGALKAIREGNAWVKDHLDEAAAMLAKQYKLELDEAKRIIKLWTWGSFTFSPTTKENVLGAQQFLLDAKQLTAPLSDIDVYLHPQLLKKVDPALVTGY